jgi:hypothetical protein
MAPSQKGRAGGEVVMKKILLIMAVFAVALVFSSCNFDDEAYTPKKEVPGYSKLVLNIGMQAPVTRAAYAADQSSLEGNINRLALGIFSAAGVKKQLEEVVSPSSSNMEFAYPDLEAGDIILVAINAPAGTFDAATSPEAFMQTCITIEEAMQGSTEDHTRVNVGNTPMFGRSTLSTVTGENAFQASVTVGHLLAKITLNSVSIDLIDATFKLTEVYLKNVPEKLDFYPVTADSYQFYDNYNDTFYQGEASTSGDADYKAYLGSGEVAAGMTINSSNKMYLYTMPNTDVIPTKLVLKGEYQPTGEVAENVTYEVYLNHNSASSVVPDGGTEKVVCPNCNYVVDITIKNHAIEYFETFEEGYSFGAGFGLVTGVDTNTDVSHTEHSGSTSDVGVETPGNEVNHNESDDRGSEAGVSVGVNGNSSSGSTETTGSTSDVNVTPGNDVDFNESDDRGSDAGVSVGVNGNSSSEGSATSGTTSDVGVTIGTTDNNNETDSYGSNEAASVTTESNTPYTQENNVGNIQEIGATPGNATANEETVTAGSNDGFDINTEQNNSNSSNSSSGDTNGVVTVGVNETDSFSEEYDF